MDKKLIKKLIVERVQNGFIIKPHDVKGNGTELWAEEVYVVSSTQPAQIGDAVNKAFGLSAPLNPKTAESLT